MKALRKKKRKSGEDRRRIWTIQKEKVEKLVDWKRIIIKRIDRIGGEKKKNLKLFSWKTKLNKEGLYTKASGSPHNKSSFYSLLPSLNSPFLFCIGRDPIFCCELVSLFFFFILCFFFLSFAPVTAKEHASKVAKTSRQKGREKGPSLQSWNSWRTRTSKDASGVDKEAKRNAWNLFFVNWGDTTVSTIAF